MRPLGAIILGSYIDRIGRRKGLVLTHSTPELFEKHMREAVASVASRAEQQRLVFLKSWNEWAESNYMEPDTRWGHAYLHALRNAVQA